MIHTLCRHVDNLVLLFFQGVLPFAELQFTFAVPEVGLVDLHVVCVVVCVQGKVGAAFGM